MQRHARGMSVELAILGLAVTLGGLAGCGGGHPVYAAAPPPPPDAGYYGSAPATYYDERPPLEEVAKHNGFSDGEQEGRRDRYRGHSFRPTHTDRYEDAPGYYRELGGNHDQYRYYYREGFERGYRVGYERG